MKSKPSKNINSLITSAKSTTQKTTTTTIATKYPNSSSSPIITKRTTTPTKKPTRNQYKINYLNHINATTTATTNVIQTQQKQKNNSNPNSNNTRHNYYNNNNNNNQNINSNNKNNNSSTSHALKSPLHIVNSVNSIDSVPSVYSLHSDEPYSEDILADKLNSSEGSRNNSQNNHNNNNNNNNKKRSRFQTKRAYRKSLKMGGNARRCLEPLEFGDCIVDSPEFRDNLMRHEKELDHTSHQIKHIVKEVKDLMNAAKVLSQRMKQLAESLKEFNFECIGTGQTDDEMTICDSLKHFCNIITSIEEEREKMLTLAHTQIIEPLEEFRKKQIGGVKENKKKFDKKTEKFCQSQERCLNMSTKKTETAIQEADATLGMHEREYIQESLAYVSRIQEVQERIKFEFVEILLAFVSGWLVFYHSAHEQGEDSRGYLQDLGHKVQKTRESFDDARAKVIALRRKYIESNMKPDERFTKRGYLFLMEKKAFKASWTKYFCTYQRQSRKFTLLQFHQMSGRSDSQEERLTLSSCQPKAADFEKRFCFDLSFKERPGVIYTFQALSDTDRTAWVEAMEGEAIPLVALTNNSLLSAQTQLGQVKTGDEYQLDDMGFLFVRSCIQVLESRGLKEEGLYRKSGVGTKVNRLLSLAINANKIDAVFVEEEYRELLESNTLASALKTYLRNLREPLMTFDLHSSFIEAAKHENLAQRVKDIHKLVYRLPAVNFEMLHTLILHLNKVASNSDRNRMTVFNLGVVFGPTLLRPKEETVAAILDIKFNNIVINILLENWKLIFNSKPGERYDERLNESEMLTRTTRLARDAAGYPSPQSPPSLTMKDKLPQSSQPPQQQAQAQQQPQQLASQTQSTTLLAKHSAYRPNNLNHLNHLEQAPSMSTSLQNIPNGVIYSTGSPASLNGGGSAGTNGSDKPPANGSNSHRRSSANGVPAGLGSIKNLHLLAQSSAAPERSPRRNPGIGVDSIYTSHGVVGTGVQSAGTNSSGRSTVVANLRHDYFVATATPAAVTAGSGGSSSSSPNHTYGSNSSGRQLDNSVSPPSLRTGAGHNTAQYSAQQASPQQQQQVQYAVVQAPRPHLPPSAYAQSNRYSPVSAVGTGGGMSSSSESVHDYDSLSSGNGAGPTAVPGRLVKAKAAPAIVSVDKQQHSSGGGGGGIVYKERHVVMHPLTTTRLTDVDQIRTELSNGTARVRTLYACMGESEGELSFEPNQIITHVRYSHEPGWLTGTLNGRTGLIPENYVEHVKPGPPTY